MSADTATPADPATLAPAQPAQPLGDDDVSTFLAEMSRSLAAYGAPAHRLEEAMSVCSERLGVAAQFFVTPTAVFASVGQGARVRTSLIRVQPGEVNLERLVLADEVLTAVNARKVGPREGVTRLAAIAALPSRYPDWLTLLSSSVVSGSAARLFGGGIREVFAAGAVGLIVGVLALLASRRRQSARLIEFIAGVSGALLAFLVASYYAPMSPQTVMLSGLILFLPGLTLTMAVTELATRNLVAGSARLMGALTILVSLGFGVAIGQRIAMELSLPLTGVAQALPAWTEVAALAAAPWPLAVIFRARPRDMLVVAVAGWASFYGARYGAAALGSELGVCIGALLVGMLSNAYERVFNRPSAVMMLPGIILLVPGAIGFRSLVSFLDHNALVGVQNAFTMVMVAVALVAGLLLANVAVAPRKAL